MPPLKRGAYLISLFGMVFHSLSIIGHLIEKEFGFAIGALVSLVCYICVFYANKYERPNFYLPHLGLNVSSLLGQQDELSFSSFLSSSAS